jgi:hypothetical protein
LALVQEGILGVPGRQDYLVLRGQVSSAQSGGVIGLLLDDDVILWWAIGVVFLIRGGGILDRVGLLWLVHAEEGRPMAGGVLLAEEVILVLALAARRLGEVADAAA